MSRDTTITGTPIPCSAPVRHICPDRKCWLNCRHAVATKGDPDHPDCAEDQRGDPVDSSR